MSNFFSSRFRPFYNRNFRLFFVVQLFSMIGTMSHDLARSWIVIELLGKASALGTLQMSSALPSVLMILQAGVIVDRSDVRVIMMATKSFLAIVALGLAVITAFYHVEFWQLLVFGIIEGLTTAFDSPAFQALTVRLVPREDFQQALALNSTNFHVARTLGPLVAGLLMAWTGPSAVFFFDGLTYLVLIFVLFKLDLGAARLKTVRAPNALRTGLYYAFRTPQLRYALLQLFSSIACIYPLLIVIFRTSVKEKFNLDAAHFGYVFTVPAIGSVCGALAFTIFKPKKPLRALFIGVPLSVIAVALEPYAPNLILTAMLMGLSGFFMYLTYAALTVSLQLDVSEEYRGRLASLTGLGFVGLGPLMALPVGMLSDHLGSKTAIEIIVVIYLSLSVLLFLLHRKTLLRVKGEL